MPDEFRVNAADGYDLGATLYRPPAGTVPSGARVVVAAATGTPQRYYRKFADFLASQGHEVVTFDYRGIGASRPAGALRSFETSFLQWGEVDFEAILQWSKAAGGETAVVGHSFGGHAFGMAPSAQQTLGAYLFGTGTGHHAAMPLSEQPKVLALWNAVGPLLLARFGYLPGRYVGLGEDLPAGVFHQWKRWTSYKRYFFDDPTATFTERVARLDRPIVAVNAVDDRWATPISAATLLQGYASASIELRIAEAAIGACGHMGYFRPGPGATLWPDVHRWIHALLAAKKARPQ
jgi:predicted alpha/beta hydrolase